MEELKCTYCNSHLEEREAFCGVCGKSLEAKEDDLTCKEMEAGGKNGKRKLFGLILVALVFLGGASILFYSGLIPNPFKDGGSAAIVDGEKIYWKDVEQKLEFYKKLYGIGDNEGSSTPEVKMALEKVRKQVLESLIQEKILLNETKKEKIDASESEVKGRIDEMKKGMNISDKDFEEFLKSHSLTVADFEKKVATELKIMKLIEKRAKEKSVSPDEIIRDLNEKANVKIFPKQAFLSSEGADRASCCSTRGGGCGGKSSTPKQVDAKTEKMIKPLALKEYGKNDESINVKVLDYGCHIQVDLYEKNKIVVSYVYQDGKLRKM